MKKSVILLAMFFCLGCGSGIAVLSWKPTIVPVKDNRAGGERQPGTITVNTSPQQPTNIHDLSGLPTS